MFAKLVILLNLVNLRLLRNSSQLQLIWGTERVIAFDRLPNIHSGKCVSAVVKVNVFKAKPLLTSFLQVWNSWHGDQGHWTGGNGETVSWGPESITCTRGPESLAKPLMVRQLQRWMGPIILGSKYKFEATSNGDFVSDLTSPLSNF